MSLGNDLAVAVGMASVDAALLRAIVQGPASGPASLVALPNGASVKTLARVAQEAGGPFLLRGGDVIAGFLMIDGPAGTARRLMLNSNGSGRLEFGLDNTPETGANEGSNVYLNLSTDGGVYLNTPMTIKRSTGTVSFPYGTAVGFTQRIFGNLGTARKLIFATANQSRVECGVDTTDDYFLNLFDDTGAYLSTPFSIVRLTGRITLNGAVRFPSVGTTASAANAFLDSGASNNLLRSTSSLKYKTVVGDLPDEEADAVIDGARPKLYHSKAPADNPSQVYVGLIAENEQENEPRLVTLGYQDQHFEEVNVAREGEPERLELRLKADATKVPDGLDYARYVCHLLSGTRRLRARVAELETQHATQAAAITDLAARVAALESAAP